MEAYISTVWRRGSLVDEKICSQHIHCTSARILLERWNKRSANDVEICGYGCMSDTTKFSGKKTGNSLQLSTVNILRTLIISHHNKVQCM